MIGHFIHALQDCSEILRWGIHPTTIALGRASHNSFSRDSYLGRLLPILVVTLGLCVATSMTRPDRGRKSPEPLNPSPQLHRNTNRQERHWIICVSNLARVTTSYSCTVVLRL
jgi:hypothetical protein